MPNWLKKLPLTLATTITLIYSSVLLFLYCRYVGIPFSIGTNPSILYVIFALSLLTAITALGFALVPTLILSDQSIETRRFWALLRLERSADAPALLLFSLVFLAPAFGFSCLYVLFTYASSSNAWIEWVLIIAAITSVLIFLTRVALERLLPNALNFDWARNKLIVHLLISSVLGTFAMLVGVLNKRHNSEAELWAAMVGFVFIYGFREIILFGVMTSGAKRALQTQVMWWTALVLAVLYSLWISTETVKAALRATGSGGCINVRLWGTQQSSAEKKTDSPPRLLFEDAIVSLALDAGDRLHVVIFDPAFKTYQASSQQLLVVHVHTVYTNDIKRIEYLEALDSTAYPAHWVGHRCWPGSLRAAK